MKMRPSDILDTRDILLQLAEESAELSQAAAKYARELYGRNPSCRTEEELTRKLEEEMADVLVTVAELPFRPDWNVVRTKQQCWIARLTEAEGKKHD